MGAGQPVFIACEYPAYLCQYLSGYHGGYTPGELAGYRRLLVWHDTGGLPRQDRSLLAVYPGAV